MDSFVDVANLVLLLVELYIVSCNIFIRKSKRKSNVLIYTFIAILGMFTCISLINSLLIRSVVQFVWCILLVHCFFEGAIKVKIL